MPDVDATITEADPALVEQLADVLELRAVVSGRIGIETPSALKAKHAADLRPDSFLRLHRLRKRGRPKANMSC